MTDIRKRLAALGLSSNEIDAYLYLIKEGSGKPTFIANSIGILRSNIYGVLDRLCEYGLVKELDGFKSKVYSAGNISESLDRLILREKEEIQRKEHIASELTGFLEGLRAGSLRNNKAVEVFEDPAHSALAIKHLFDIAKEEILSVSHPPYFSSIFNAESKETDKADEEKKGYLTDEPGDEDYRMYCIYQLEDISLDSFKEIVRSTISLGDR
ncbi:MAG: helix-turn-helix domain-containing protein, partial [Candidatus Fermentibacteria bacterium]